MSYRLTMDNIRKVAAASAKLGAAVKLEAMGGNAARATAHLPTSPQNLQFYAAHQAEIEPLAEKIAHSGGDSDN